MFTGAFVKQMAHDPRADVTTLERVIAMYERLQAKEAELAFNAAKGRILKNLARVRIVRNRPALYEIENGKPQKGTYEALKTAPALGARRYGSLLFRRTAGARRDSDSWSSKAPAERPF